MPVFVIAGLILKADKVSEFTNKFVEIKREFYPGLSDKIGRPIDLIREEIKGAELRNPKSLKSTRKWKHTRDFLSRLINLVHTYEGRIVGKILVKKPDQETNAMSIYTSAVQQICTEFDHFLESKSSTGIVVADSRNHVLDVQASHSIFTQKFQRSGDAYPRLLEMPVFGKSDNHAGIQMCDILCSALLFPFASNAFCHEYSEKLRNIHVQPSHEKLRKEFARR
ncbi:DUF3800 domain-containing protein, partial [Sansalvadorimonas verongulae]|uniref:DUF3800 domain-containing protein n=1 Tax=Sansalvadorimonas verongulae TaxID=2172824 RepID=UPI001E4A6C8C